MISPIEFADPVTSEEALKLMIDKINEIIAVVNAL